LKTLEGTQQRVLILPGQYRGSNALQRVYSKVNVSLYASTINNWQGPVITNTAYTVAKASAALTVTTVVTDSNGLCRVVAAYTDGEGVWQSFDLSPLGSGEVVSDEYGGFPRTHHLPCNHHPPLFNGNKDTWQGSVSFNEDKEIEYFVQAVDLAGNITVDDNTGNYYSATVLNSNQPPNTPSSPIPTDGADNISVTPTLGWQGGDPDGDAVTYTIAFGAATPPPIIATGVTTTNYNPGVLGFGATYYWVITAADARSKTVGATWQFATIKAKPGEYQVYLPLVIRQ